MALLGKFGVAHPLYNNRFSQPHTYALTYSSISSKLVTPGTLPDGSATNMDQLLGHRRGESQADDRAGKINKLILGPAANDGELEEISINFGGTVDTDIALEDTPVNSYTNGDAMTLLAIGMPDGWHGALPGVSTKLFPCGIMVHEDSYSDLYGFNVLNLTSPGATRAASLPIPPLMANTYYRLEVYYKSDASSATHTVRVYDGALGTAVNLSNTSGVWASVSTVFQSSITQPTDFAYLYLQLASGTVQNLNIHSISLSHVIYDQRTSGGGTVYTQDGVSTIEEYPVLGSVRVKRLHSGKKVIKALAGRYQGSINSGFELPVTRYQIQYQLQDISVESRTVIEELINWQERGNFLNHFPGLAGVPYCLTGTLSISGLPHRITDLDSTNVKLVFKEAAL